MIDFLGSLAAAVAFVLVILGLMSSHDPHACEALLGLYAEGRDTAPPDSDEMKPLRSRRWPNSPGHHCQGSAAGSLSPCVLGIVESDAVRSMLVNLRANDECSLPRLAQFALNR